MRANESTNLYARSHSWARRSWNARCPAMPVNGSVSLVSSCAFELPLSRRPACRVASSRRTEAASSSHGVAGPTMDISPLSCFLFSRAEFRHRGSMSFSLPWEVMVLEIVRGYKLSIRNSAVQARDHPRGGSPRTPSILACLLHRTLCHSTTWRSSRNRAWARAGARDLRAPPQGSGLRTHTRSGHRGGTALPRGGWWSNPLLRG